MKFLIIAQDLRVSGTSEGIVSRSFLAKLRKIYPESIIDVVYLKQSPSDDQLDLLPVDSISEHILNLKIPVIVRWIHKLYWRIFHISLLNNHVEKIYASYVKKIDYLNYNHVFIRSAGVNYEVTLACRDLPILNKAIINFHDPYPDFWYPGATSSLTGMELFKLKAMQSIVLQSKKCVSPAQYLSQDLEMLYGSRKKFYTLPHQYDDWVFDLSDASKIFKKSKRILISYHGAIMFGRDIDVLLDAYADLILSNETYKENTEFVVRVKGVNLKKLAAKYATTPNIKILELINFSNSCNEQLHEADITIILENGPLYSNTLVGKAPFLAAIKKAVFVIAPPRSEMRGLINEKYIASYSNKQEISQKLELLISNRLKGEEILNPFGSYFSDENFKIMLEKILNNPN